MSSAAGGQQYTSLSRVDEASPLSEPHTDDLSAQMAQMQKKLDDLLDAVSQPQLWHEAGSPKVKNSLDARPRSLSRELSHNSAVGVSSSTDVAHAKPATGAALGLAADVMAEEGRHGEEHDGAEQGIWNSQKVAVMISVVAGLLAWADMRQAHWKTAYLTHHTTMIDGWAHYQAKIVRSNINNAEFWLLSALRNSTTLLGSDSSALDAEIARTQHRQILLRDQPGGHGAEQLMCIARVMEDMRDAALENYEAYEVVVTAFQVIIVLASTSVITKQHWFASIALVGTVVTTGWMIQVMLLAHDSIEDNSYDEDDQWFKDKCFNPTP
jgi:hypothetical protein